MKDKDILTKLRKVANVLPEVTDEFGHHVSHYRTMKTLFANGKESAVNKYVADVVQSYRIAVRQANNTFGIPERMNNIIPYGV